MRLACHRWPGLCGESRSYSTPLSSATTRRQRVWDATLPALQASTTADKAVSLGRATRSRPSMQRLKMRANQHPLGFGYQPGGGWLSGRPRAVPGVEGGDHSRGPTRARNAALVAPRPSEPLAPTTKLITTKGKSPQYVSERVCVVQQLSAICQSSLHPNISSLPWPPCQALWLHFVSNRL